MKKVFLDQMGTQLNVPSSKRIISLVPSISELLFALELGDRVVGITKFCIHPQQWFHLKPKIGSTKKVDFEKVKALKPDLIIGNKEENTIEDIEKLREIAPVWISDVNSIEDAYAMILELGKLVDKEEKANWIISKWKAYFKNNFNNGKGKRIIYFIWKNPLMVVGKETYINAFLEKVGYKNVITDTRYPFLNELTILDPEEVLLSTEPYPFKEKDFQFFQNLFPNATIRLVDGELFSWYGVRNIIHEL